MSILHNLLLLSGLIFINHAKAEYEPEHPLVSISKKTFLSTLLTKPLIEKRCEIYQGNSIIEDFVESLFDPFISYSCERSSSLLFKILDIKTLIDEQGYLGRALFSSKLLQLLNDPKTTTILNFLINNFENATKSHPFILTELLSNSPFFLEKEALIEFSAVAFQDTNSLQHIYYLVLLKSKEKWKNSSLKSKNLELLAILNSYFQEQFFAFQYQNSNTHYQKYKFFPQDTIQLDVSNFQPAIYHFYIPAYLSQMLKNQKLQNYYAFITPITLRVLYEQLFNQETNLTKLETYLIALGENEPPITSTYKQIDLYLSAVGSYWALNIKPKLNFNEFANHSKKNMPKTLRLLTKNL